MFSPSAKESYEYQPVRAGVLRILRGAADGMLVSTMAQPMTPMCNVSALAGMHSIQLLRQLSDPRRCPGAAARLPTDGTNGGLVIDGGTANDAEDAVHWLRMRPDWRAIGFEPNRAECQRANATLAASARGKATMESKLVETQGRPRFGQKGAGQGLPAPEGAQRGRHLGAASLGQSASWAASLLAGHIELDFDLP